MPDKVKKSYRLTQETADAIALIAEREGTTETEAVSRAVMSFAADDSDGQESVAEEEKDARTDNGSAEAVSFLEANVEDLRAQVATLTEQLRVKDEQIAAANRHLDQAQALHAGTEAANAKRLESADGDAEGGKRSGFWSRLFRGR